MNRYIDLDKAIEAFWPLDPECDGSDGATPVSINGIYSSDDVEAILSDIPAADVAPVRHGHWYRPKLAPTYRIEAPYYICSLCSDKEDDKSPYCPECGAKMDEEV